MKLMIPATGVVVASGLCCCCGDFTETLDGMNIGMEATGEEGSDITVTTEMADGTKVTSTTDGGATVEATLGGTCGRFKDLGITAPSGWSVMACSDDGSSGGLVLTGGSDPAAACASMKSWATGKGFTVSMENDISGTTSIIAEKDATRLVLACSNAGGMNSVSVSLSPK